MAYSQRHAEDADAGGPSSSSCLARQVKTLLASGEVAYARDRFDELVAVLQARANRIALAYLRSPAEADEAVQDAFVRVFQRIAEYKDELPFDGWFTRILVNGCIDRGRARRRRDARVGPLLRVHLDKAAEEAQPADRLLVDREWRGAVGRAVQDLPARQRAVFALCHYEDRSSSEVARLLGLKESTVRVHLFRAVQKLRTALQGWRDAR
jgi:RNA polymerase sigma-70 factor, ECF subfamily